MIHSRMPRHGRYVSLNKRCAADAEGPVCLPTIFLRSLLAVVGTRDHLVEAESPAERSQLDHPLACTRATKVPVVNSRGGPPLPGKPGGGAKPAGGAPGNPAPGNPGPPIPAAGPCSPMPAPLPAGLEMPVPACIAVGAPPAAPPGALCPSLAAGSDGGGPSTEHDTTVAPLIMANPSMRFSSVSTI